MNIATPCAQTPDAWELDNVRAARKAEEAIRMCWRRCPMLAECTIALQREIANHGAPSGVVWAGRAFGAKGQPLVVLGKRLRVVRDSQVVPAAQETTPVVTVNEAA